MADMVKPLDKILSAVAKKLETADRVGISLEETVNRRTGEYEHTVMARVNGDRGNHFVQSSYVEKKESTLPGAYSNLKKSLENGGWQVGSLENKRFMVSSKYTRQTDEAVFRLPAHEDFSFEEVAGLLGGKGGFKLGRHVSYIGANSDMIQELAKKFGVSPGKLAENYRQCLEQRKRKAEEEARLTAERPAGFRLPSFESYRAKDVSEILGVEAHRLRGKIDYNGTKGWQVQNLAREFGVLDKLEENYQKYLNSKRPTSE